MCMWHNTLPLSAGSVGTKRRTGLSSGGAHLKLSQTSKQEKKQKGRALLWGEKQSSQGQGWAEALTWPAWLLTVSWETVSLAVNGRNPEWRGEWHSPSRGGAHRTKGYFGSHLCVCVLCICIMNKGGRKATTKGKREGVCLAHASSSFVWLELIQQKKERASQRRSWLSKKNEKERELQEKEETPKKKEREGKRRKNFFFGCA